MAELDPETVDKPIIAPVSDVPEGVITLVRYLLAALGGIMVNRGWISDSTVNDLTGLALIALPTLYGLWLTRHKNAKLRALASLPQVPDSVARVGR